MNLKIIYLSNERFPASFACTIQQINMCTAFAKNGAEVLLLTPHFHDMPPVDREQICRFYDVEPLFSIRQIPSLMSCSKPPAGARRRFRLPWVGGLSLYFFMRREARNLIKSGARSIVYSRSLNGTMAFLAARRGTREPYKVVYEVHSLKDQKPQRRLHSVLRAADGLVVISEAVRRELSERFSLPSHKIMVAPSAVRSEMLQKPLPPQEARRRLGLPEMPTIVYAGQLLPGKGAELLIEAGTLLPSTLHIVIVGGLGADLERLHQVAQAKRLRNLSLIGFVPPAQVPLYLAAANVLVLPTQQEYINSDYTSPLKLFEYMAAARPIVSSDLPVLREILRDGENALFFRSGDAADLADAVLRLVKDTELGMRLAQKAHADVQEHTWEKRAKIILDFMQSL